MWATWEVGGEMGIQKRGGKLGILRLGVDPIVAKISVETENLVDLINRTCSLFGPSDMG